MVTSASGPRAARTASFRCWAALLVKVRPRTWSVGHPARPDQVQDALGHHRGLAGPRPRHQQLRPPGAPSMASACSGVGSKAGVGLKAGAVTAMSTPPGGPRAGSGTGAGTRTTGSWRRPTARTPRPGCGRPRRAPAARWPRRGRRVTSWSKACMDAQEEEAELDDGTVGGQVGVAGGGQVVDGELDVVVDLARAGLASCPSCSRRCAGRGCRRPAPPGRSGRSSPGDGAIPSGPRRRCRNGVPRPGRRGRGRPGPRTATTGRAWRRSRGGPRRPGAGSGRCRRATSPRPWRGASAGCAAPSPAVSGSRNRASTSCTRVPRSARTPPSSRTRRT